MLSAFSLGLDSLKGAIERVTFNTSMESPMTLARDLDTVPAGCQSCTWLGALSPPFEDAKCPHCNAQVSPLRQKGLDKLRGSYRRLGKIGFSVQFTREQRVAEYERLERFFESIGRPL